MHADMHIDNLKIPIGKGAIVENATYVRTTPEMEQKIITALGRVKIDEILRDIIVSTDHYFQIKRDEVIRWARRHHSAYNVSEEELRQYLFEQLYDRAEIALRKSLLKAK